MRACNEAFFYNRMCVYGRTSAQSQEWPTWPNQQKPRVFNKGSVCLLLQEFILNSLQNKCLYHSSISSYGIIGRFLLVVLSTYSIFFLILMLRLLNEALKTPLSLDKWNRVCHKQRCPYCLDWFIFTKIWSSHRSETFLEISKQVRIRIFWEKSF